MPIGHAPSEKRDDEPPLPRLACSAAADDRIAFRRGLHPLLADAAVDPDRSPDASAQVETWRLGPFAVTRATTPGMRFERRSSDRAADEGDLWVFRLSRGPARTRIGGDRAGRIGPARLWLKRATGPSLALLPAGDHVILTVPADACPDLTAGLARLPGGRVQGAGAGLLAEILGVLPARLRATAAADLAPFAEVLRRMIACALPDDPRRADLPAAAEGPPLRDRVIRVMRDNIGSARLDVDRIRRLTGVSRSALYRMFEPDGGVASFIRDARLRLVLADLRDPSLGHLPIARIAERRGLHNAPSFSRAFRRAFGCSPSEARAAARLGAPPAALAPEAPRAGAPGAAGRGISRFGP